MLLVESTYNLTISLPYIRVDNGTAANTTMLDLKAIRDPMTHKEVCHGVTPRPVGQEWSQGTLKVYG